MMMMMMMTMRGRRRKFCAKFFSYRNIENVVGTIVIIINIDEDGVYNYQL